MPQTASLVEILQNMPTSPSQDDLLAGFLQYAENLGLTLYAAQEEAILELFGHSHVILNTPTGSGKSLVAMAMAFMAMAEGKYLYYTCPIKALVNEKFFALCEAFGPENVGLMTGDGAVNSGAHLICCTAEILSNLALRQSDLPVDYVVMDEFHYYGDQERGAAWQIPLITLKEAQFLLMSATLGDTDHISQALEDFSGRPVVKVQGGERPVPLNFDYLELTFSEAVTKLVEEQKAPVYLVNFTQKSCAERAQDLTSLALLSKEERQALGGELAGFRFDTPYGRELSRFIKAGIGVHHAALLPKYRMLVEKLAQKGFLKVISGTDSLGVGVNVPIRTVLFTQLCKFDGQKSALLSARQFHQIAGRAGRRGFDSIGYVVALAPEHIVENRRIELKIQKQPHLKNKLVKKSPPKFGFVNWDEDFYKKIMASPPEALTPVLNVDHAMVLSAIQSGQSNGYGNLIEIIHRSQLTKGQQKFQVHRAALLARSLLTAEVIQIVPAADGSGRKEFRVRPDFQEDFSLNQALSLFLVKAAQLYDMNDVEYPLALLSLVESICDNPAMILNRQLDKIKGELITQWKNEGVPYEERMERLEQVEYYKPNAEQLYEAFNDFRRFHPWVKGDTVQPKSIARDMIEKSCDFNNYVIEYGLERLEGALLRYLSQVVKVCEQNVPRQYKTEGFEEIVTYLRTLVRRVDSTLLDEWENMVAPGTVRPEAAALVPIKVAVDIAKDRSAFMRRLRAEVRLLLNALARRDWEKVQLALRPGSCQFKDEKELTAFMAPYYAEYARISTSHRAILSEHTLITESGPRVWSISQVLLDDEGATEFALQLQVDLNRPYDADLPVIELVGLEGDC